MHPLAAAAGDLARGLPADSTDEGRAALLVQLEAVEAVPLVAPTIAPDWWAEAVRLLDAEHDGLPLDRFGRVDVVALRGQLAGLVEKYPGLTVPPAQPAPAPSSAVPLRPNRARGPRVSHRWSR